MKKFLVLSLVAMIALSNITIAFAQEENVEIGIVTENEATPKVEIISVNEQSEEIKIEGIGIAASDKNQLSIFVNDVLLSEDVQKEALVEIPNEFKAVKDLKQEQMFKFAVNVPSSEMINGDNQISVRLVSDGLVLSKADHVSAIEQAVLSQTQDEAVQAEPATQNAPSKAKIANNEVSAYSAPVNPAATMYLDKFAYDEDANLINFNGWSMSNTAGTWVQVLIDGSLVVNGASRAERNDIYAAVKGFGGKQENPLPGFGGSISVQNYGSGTHSVIIRTVNTQRVLDQRVTSFTVSGENSATFIDRAVVNEDTLTVSGWSMSSHKNNGVWVQVLIDDVLVTNSTTRSRRDDVVTSLKGYGSAKMNPTPGYSVSMDISKLNAGQHKVTVRTVTAYAVLDSVSTTFNVKQEKTRTHIDAATVTNNILNVSGWSMSSHRKNGVWVQVLIDDAFATNSTVRNKRGDVSAAIQDCGSQTQNPTPGYSANLDVSKLSNGKHKVTIRTVTAYAVLDSVSTYFNVVSGSGGNSGNNGGNTNKPSTNAGYKMNIESSQVVNGNIALSGWALTSKEGSWLQVLVDGVLFTNDASRHERDDVLSAFSNFDASLNEKAGYSTNINVSKLLNGEHTLTVRIVDAYKVYDSISTKFRTANSAGSITSPLFGIDVSEHNGSINWATASKHIDFAMIRAGWGYYTEDKTFQTNIKGAQDNGVPVGIYFYTYALNMEEAKKEVDGLIASLNGKNIQYPVIIDMEDADGYKRKNGMPSNAMLQEICIYFCERLTAAGYTAGVYASLDWWNNRLENPKLNNYVKWIAQWNSSCTYKNPYQMWQYTSDGSLPGISGRVDMNYSYYAY